LYFLCELFVLQNKQLFIARFLALQQIKYQSSGKWQASKSAFGRSNMETVTTNESPSRQATRFWVDPHLPQTVPYHQTLALDEAERGDGPVEEAGDGFSCVLVTMWPPPLDVEAGDGQATTLRKAYDEFRGEVMRCFQRADLMHCSDSHGLPRAYTYIPECLHITVATLHRFDVPATPDERRVMQEIYTDLFRQASKRPNWPGTGSKMRFAIDSARIGERAGILLWKETTGNLQRIRDCVAEVHKLRNDDIVQAVGEEKAKSFQIPNIIHSTFLRFADAPRTDWDAMQTKFAAVQERLQEMFGDCVVETDSVRLACERRPYMHIPCDEKHVFETIGL